MNFERMSCLEKCHSSPRLDKYIIITITFYMSISSTHVLSSIYNICCVNPGSHVTVCHGYEDIEHIVALI